MTKHTCLPAVEKWGVQEVVCPGFADGNPFRDYEMHAEFTSDKETVSVEGFYDGGDRYIARFMPSHEGTYTYRVWGSFSSETYTGTFTVTAPAESNHGPVHVHNTYHFAYADGTKYVPMGTTCYAWIHQPEDMREQTLKTLKNSPFNKIRMCVFPKHYDYNFAEPDGYPFPAKNEFSFDINRDNFWKFNARNTPCKWDFAAYNVEFFRKLDDMVLRLMQMGIEADIILFHPYDRWGFANMTQQEDAAYLRYVIARLGAYRNVWWSLANEWDFMDTKTADDWENIGQTIAANDPYQRLLSNHNGRDLFDYHKEYVTHCCVQRQGHLPIEDIAKWRETYQKPVVVDEMCYEGNLCHGWGNIDAEELVRRYWLCTVYGGYGGHGETFAGDVLWWSHGGILHGISAVRLDFLLKVVQEVPGGGLEPVCGEWGLQYAAAQQPDGKEFRLYYYDLQTPAYMEYNLPEDKQYAVELIDTWNMTIKDLGVHSGKFRITMPQRRYMAVRITGK